MIGVTDWEELEALLPECDFEAIAISEHPTSPENRALLDASEEDEPVWSTPAQHARRDITNGLYFYAGRMPEHEAVAWYGYLQGRLESGDLTEAEHADLVRLLPSVENNPIDFIVESASATKAAPKA